MKIGGENTINRTRLTTGENLVATTVVTVARQLIHRAGLKTWTVSGGQQLPIDLVRIRSNYFWG